MQLPNVPTPNITRRISRRLTWSLLLTASLACAGNLQVAPILLEFSDGEQAQALWLENTGDQALHAQVRVQRWTQNDAGDVLEPSQMLLARPAIIQTTVVNLA